MDEKVFLHAVGPNRVRSEWSNDQVTQLIQLYRDRPVLWDSRLNEHKDRELRHTVLLELANAFGVTKEEIERKIKNLLSHFAREVKKEQAALEDNLCYKSKWFYYEKLQFLKQRKKRRTITDVEFMKTESEEGFDVVLLPEYDDPGPEPPPEPAEISRMFAPSEKSYAPAQIPQTTPPLTPDQEVLSIMREMRARQEERDEFSLFGEQVALKLRKLASPHARFMVQHIINTTLFEAEMGKYDNPPGPPFPLSVLPQPGGVQTKKDCT